VVIRQLQQHKDAFDAFTAQKARELADTYGPGQLKQVVGADVDANWVAAKLVGRWKNGRPLIGNPRGPGPFGDADNDFAFGRDDPQGQACPLGAHIRRANPRDSLEPDDPLEQLITRRHSLIRRGRSYFYDRKANRYATRRPRAGSETGLLFVALCSDLERQFELVQQTWVGSPAFHGLTNEPDPIATRRRANGASRQFTIPTNSGPLTLEKMESFVDLRGGGYFFAPSRAALAYLVGLSTPRDDSIPDPPPSIPPLV
jgi:deferrochelatase/peroxidase EfeB